MSKNSTPIFATGKIDPALEALLKKRGMTGKLNQLKLASAQADTVVADTIKNIGKNAYKFTAAPVVDSIKTLGTAFGGALASKEVKRIQDEQTKNEVETHNLIMKKLSDPKNTPEKKQKLLKILTKTSKNPTVQASTQLVENMPSSKEIVSSAVQLASVAVMGYKPGLNSSGVAGKVISRPEAKNIASISAANSAVQAADIARKYGKPIAVIAKETPHLLKNIVIGAGFFGGEAGKTKSPEEAIKEGLIWGVAGEAAPIVLGSSLRALGYLGKKAWGEPTVKIAGDVYEGIKRYAESTPIEKRIADAPDVTKRLLAVIEPAKSPGQKIAKGFVTSVEAVKKLPSQISDRFAPLSDLQEKARQVKGTPLSEEEKAYNIARTRSASQGIAEDKAKQFKNEIIDPYSDIENDVKARMVALDAIDRSQLASGKIAGGRTAVMEQIPEKIEKSVVQIKDVKTGKVEYKVIPSGQLNDFHLLIDDTSSGIAGKVIDGKVYHLTAKSPAGMNSLGHEYTGIAKVHEIPSSANGFKPKASIPTVKDDLAMHIQQSQDRGIEERIQQAIDANNKFNNKILEDMRDGGLIDQATIDRLKAAHPNYIPHKVVQEEIDRALGTTASVNVSDTGLKKAVGSTRAIEDPYETTINRLPGIYKKIEDNKIGNSIVTNQEKYKIFSDDEMYALDTAENQTKRQVVISKLKDLWKKNRKDIRSLGTVKKEIKFENSRLESTENTITNPAIEKLGTKFDDTQKELSALVEEAQTLAADQAPRSKVNQILDKVLNREKKAYMLNGDLAEQLGKFNALKDTQVAERTQLLKDIELKQKALDVMIEERKSIIGELKKELSDAGKKKKPLDSQTIEFFRNGKKESWVVPAEIAGAVKNLDYERANAVFRALAFPTKVLRAFATKYNLPFSLQNLARDKQTQAATAKAFIEDLAQKAGVTPQAINLTDKEILGLYKKSGGIGGTIFDETTNGTEILRKMESNGFMTTINENANPGKLISKLNEVFERDTRLSTFRMGLERGLSPRDAALAARDATVDFDKMGTFMRSLNQIIPFINARMQGAINVGKVVSMSPEQYARSMMLTSVYPTVGLYQHNRQFQSFQNIPQNILDNYWVIMTGEADGIDNNGVKIRVPQFIRIKKGEAQQLISIPVEHYLNKMDGISYRNTSRMLYDTLGNMSPISVGSFDSQNFWISAVSQFGPLANISVGLGTNINPYTGTDIIPQSRKDNSPYLQYSKTTPENLKEIGKMLNASPAQIDFVLNSFGAVPGQVVREANRIEMNVKGENKQKSLTGTWFGENLAQDPILKSFVGESGEYGSPAMRQKLEAKQGFKTEIQDRKVINKEKAEEIFDSMQKIQDKDKRIEYLDNQHMAPEVKEQLKTVAANSRTMGVLSTNDSTELRARVIFDELAKMKAAGTSKEARIDYLDNLKKNKIITKEVKAELMGLNAYLSNSGKLENIANSEERAKAIMDSVKQLKEAGTSSSLIGRYLTKLQNDGIIDENIKQLMYQIKKSQ